MHGYSRLGGARNGSSPPSSPRFRHGRNKSNGWANGFVGGGIRDSKERTLEKLLFGIMSAVFRRRGLLLFAPLLYISGMLLYMGSLNFDAVSIKNGVVCIHKRAPPGSVYRSPQVFEKLWPLLESESSNKSVNAGGMKFSTANACYMMDFGLDVKVKTFLKCCSEHGI